MVRLRAGQRLFSTACTAQVVIVRAPEGDVDISCGGEPMLDVEQETGAAAASIEAGDGPMLGKRYADEKLGLELLCTKAGNGALAVNGRTLALKGAKPLPSSD